MARAVTPVINVNPDAMHGAAKALADAANTLSDGYDAVGKAMRDIGSMAGSDPAARDWGTDFDSGLSAALDAHYSSIAALANCAELVDATATNHFNADGQSVIGPKPPPEVLGIHGNNLIPLCLAPPPKSAGQPDDSEPAWWRWIKDRVGNIWPNGHQDKLHAAASALRAARDAASRAATDLNDPVKTVRAQVSPEIDPAVTCLTTVQTALNDISGVYNSLAQACDDQASHIDSAHSEMEEAGAELAAWTAVDYLTDGAASGRVAKVAAKVVGIYEKFRKLLEAARVGIRAGAGVGSRLRTALKPLVEAFSKIKDFSSEEKDLEQLEKDVDEASVDPKNASNTPGTAEYGVRRDELARDPAHGGAVSDKSLREADVGLGMERQGEIPGPIARAQFDANGMDQGEFTDANGQNWDVKAPTDTFPGGPRAGQEMPPGMRGRYDRSTFENQVQEELNKNQNVIIDPKNLSPTAQQDVQNLIDSHPGWQGKVKIYNEGN